MEKAGIMDILRNVLALILLAVGPITDTGATTPEFQQITTSAPHGYLDLPVTGFGDLPQASFSSTLLVPAADTNISLGVDPSPGELYAGFPGAGKQFLLFPYREYADLVFNFRFDRVFIVEVTSANAPMTNLYAGIDSNSDGQPQQNEQMCQSSTAAGSTTVARCVIDLFASSAGLTTTAGNVWVLVDVPQGAPGAIYDVRLSSGTPTIAGGTMTGLTGAPLGDWGVAGPGHAAAGATLPLHIWWGPLFTDNYDAFLPNVRYYGAVLVDATIPQSFWLGQSGFVPFSLTRSVGQDDVIEALAPIALRTKVIEPAEALQHMFIDVSTAATLKIDSSEDYAIDPSGAGSTLSFYLVRADFPTASASTQIAPAPSDAAAAAKWTVDLGRRNELAIPVTAGRWYIVATNTGPREAVLQLTTVLEQTAGSEAPALIPGNYFNPERSGSGIFISRASGQQVVDWYTYREDGTPTWYIAQSAAPEGGAGSWRSPLYRVTWDGDSATPNYVGEMLLTALAPDRAIFSWHLFGQSGSEVFQLLAAPACVNAGGTVNLNGEWYPPMQPGYGFDALVLPTQQFAAFYLYDDTGNPRWVVGSNGPFAASSTVPMVQSTGFCPLCEYRSITTQPAGDFIVSYTNAAQGHLTTAITLNPPLSGTWNIDQPIARLTGAATCP